MIELLKTIGAEIYHATMIGFSFAIMLVVMIGVLVGAFYFIDFSYEIGRKLMEPTSTISPKK